MSDGLIFALQADMVNAKDNIKDLYVKNEKRRASQESFEVRFQLVMDRMEEQSAQNNDHAEKLEQLHMDMTTLTASVMGMKMQIDVVEKDVSEIKERRFNWSKFMSGLITTRGMTLALCVTAIVLAMTGYGDQISGIFKAATGVK